MKTNALWIGITDCIFTISRLFCDIFLLAYLLKVSQDNFLNIGFYKLASIITVLFLAYILANTLKSGRDILVYRLGILSNFLLFFWLWVIGNNVASHMFITGIVAGNAIYLRALGRNFLISKNISENQMIKFRGYLEFIKATLRVLFPFIIGLLLWQKLSFNQALFLISITLIFELTATFFIKDTSPQTTEKINLKKFVQENIHNKILQTSMKMDFFKGLTTLGILPIAITLYTAYIFGDNFKLGTITSCFSLCIIVVNFIFAKFCKYKNFTTIILWSGMITFLCSLAFVLYPHKFTFLLYNFSYVTAMQFIWLLSEVNVFNVINIKKEFKAEYLTFREFVLGAGRLISIGLFIFITSFQNTSLLNLFLFLMTICVLVMNLYLISLNKQLFKVNCHNQPKTKME